jgi:phosphoribosylpyrophosphate synthetase
MEDYLFYCGRGNGSLSHELLTKLGEYLGAPLKYEFIDFGVWRDGCPNDRIINFENIQDRNVIFFDSLLNKEDLYDCLSLCCAFKHQYEAKRLIAVTPFNLLRRCDHDEKAEEIQYLRQYIRFLANAGVDDLVVCTPHSENFGAYCKEYGINFHPAYMDFTQDLKTIVSKEGKNVFYSPDEGSIARAIAHAKKIKGAIVLFDLKNRKTNNQTEIVNAVEGQINEIIDQYKSKFEFEELHYVKPELFQGANIIMIDDEMASGETANKTGHKLKELGAKNVYFAFTHPVCVNGWKSTLFHENPFTRVISGNTIPRGESNRTGGKIVDVSVDQVLASDLYGIVG